MDSLRDVTVDDFKVALTDQRVRTIQIIQGALGGGVFTFLMVAIAMFFVSEADPDAEPTMLMALTGVHLLVALSSYMIAMVVPKFFYRDERMAQLATGGLRQNRGRNVTVDSPQICFEVIQYTTIVRLALFEGTAFIGLVICVVGSTGGIIHRHPEYWLNLFSTAVMLAFVIATFPTRDRIIRSFLKNIRQDTFSDYRNM